MKSPRAGGGSTRGTPDIESARRDRLRIGPGGLGKRNQATARFLLAFGLAFAFSVAMTFFNCFGVNST